MDKLKLLATAALMFSLVSCGKPSSHTPVAGKEAYKNMGERAEDSKVIFEVKRAPLLNPIIPNDLIDLAIDKGMVQISGFVRSPEEASVAILTVKSVPGVRDVINNLIVPEGIKASPKNRQESHSDLRLIAQVEHNFKRNKIDHRDSIHLAAHRGVLQLSGFVHSAEEVNNAVAIATNTEGVAEVINSLIILSSDEYAIRRGVAEVNNVKK